MDVIGSFPFTAVIGGKEDSLTKEQTKSIKAFAKYWKIPKLLRLGRLLKYTVKYAQYFYLMNMVNLFMVLMHWNACLYAYIAYASLDERRYAELNTQFGNNVEKKGGTVSIWTLYGEALYMSVVMLNGISRVQSDDPSNRSVEVICRCCC